MRCTDTECIAISGHVCIQMLMYVGSARAIIFVLTLPYSAIARTLCSYDAVCKTLKQARKMPYACRTASDVHTAATSILTDRITPIVCVNNVTGDGHDLLRQLLLELPPRITVEAIKRVSEGCAM